MDGKELAMLATDVLIKTYQISPKRIAFMMRDGAGVNDVCVRQLSGFMLHMNDIKCFSHMLNRVLDALECPLVKDFTNKWGNLIAKSGNLRLEFKKTVGVKLKRFSRIRWASRWECAKQLFDQWERVEVLLKATTACQKGDKKMLENVDSRASRGACNDR